MMAFNECDYSIIPTIFRQNLEALEIKYPYWTNEKNPIFSLTWINVIIALISLIFFLEY